MALRFLISLSVTALLLATLVPAAPAAGEGEAAPDLLIRITSVRQAEGQNFPGIPGATPFDMYYVSAEMCNFNPEPIENILYAELSVRTGNPARPIEKVLESRGLFSLDAYSCYGLEGRWEPRGAIGDFTFHAEGSIDGGAETNLANNVDERVVSVIAGGFAGLQLGDLVLP